MVQLALKKQLCSLSVCAMWPLSGTFFRCSRQLCSQVSSHINDSLYWFGVEQIEDRTPTRACDSLHYIEGRSPEKDSCWIWNRSHQKKLDAVRFYIFTVTDLIGKEHKTHYLALSIIELYFGSCLNVYLCQEKNELKSTMYCCAVVFSGFMLGFDCKFGVLLFSFYYLRQWSRRGVCTENFWYLVARIPLIIFQVFCQGKWNKILIFLFFFNSSMDFASKHNHENWWKFLYILLFYWLAKALWTAQTQ